MCRWAFWGCGLWRALSYTFMSDTLLCSRLVGDSRALAQCHSLKVFASPVLVPCTPTSQVEPLNSPQQNYRVYCAAKVLESYKASMMRWLHTCSCSQVAHNDAAGAPPTESLDQYVIVNKTDVLDAIGSFVAAYLVTLPEAQKLQPAELQAALKKTFRVGPRASPPWLLNALDYLKAGIERLEFLA